MKAASYALLAALTGGAALMLAVVMATTPRPAAVAASEAFSLAFRPHPGARLPLATTLLDERGREIALGEFFTKSPVILVLEYLRCKSLCGVTLRNLLVALKRLPLEAGRDYQLVAISIDPRDTPADAAAARQHYHDLLARSDGAAGMHFLAASSAAVRQIASSVGFAYRYDAALDAFMHPAGFVVAAPDGRISHYIEGVEISPTGLVGALADAEQDKSPDLLTRVLLLCHESVALGRYTVPVLAALSIANLAAALSLITIFVAIRRRGHG